MEEVKIGDILFLRTTGEPVQVLGKYDNGAYKVRRPIVTKDEGIKHTDDGFEAFELETEGEKFERDLHQDYMMYKRQMKMVEMTSPKTPDLQN